jgi:plastocyanin
MNNMSTRRTVRTVRRTALAAVLSAGVMALSACGGGSSSTAMQSSPHSAASSMSMGSSDSGMSMSMITIKNFTFSGPSSVKAGASVMVTNQDAEAHTLTADNAGSFDVTVNPGKSVTFTAPSKPGSYPYHCNFHSNMQGMLTVR